MKTIITVLKWIFLAALILFIVFSLFSAFSLEKNNGNGFFGLKAFVVASDSMSDTFVTGDIIICKNVDADKLAAGDIITFVSTNQASYGKIVTHKIRAVNGQGNSLSFTTYGTTTNVDDTIPVSPDKILGKYSFKMEGCGNMFLFFQSTIGFVICILLPFVILIAWQLLGLIKQMKHYRQVYGKDAKAEQEALQQEVEMLRQKVDELTKSSQDDNK